MSPSSPLSQLPIWQAIVAILIPLVGLIGWLAVLGSRVQVLEDQAAQIGPLRQELAEVRVDVRWIRERLAEAR